MSVTENILKVKNAQGVITSIKDRGSAASLLNQEYEAQVKYYNEVIVPQATDKASEYSLVSYPSDKPFENIPLDVVVRYSPEVSSTITMNPIQSGVNVNDHIYSNPDTMTILFGSSDIKGSLARLSGVIKSFTSIDTLKNPVTPSRALLNLLYRAKEEHTLLCIDDGLHTYTDMIITNISYDKDKTTYRTLVATVMLQQFIFVNTAELGSKRPAVVPGQTSTFAKVWDSVTAIRLL